MSEYQEIQQCRVAGTTNLVSVLNLRLQALTGVFADGLLRHAKEFLASGGRFIFPLLETEIV